MSRAALAVHFHNDETLRNLELTPEALGVSVDDLAEVAIERELAAVGVGLEGRLTRSLERLKSNSPADLDQDIRDFARSEIEIEDPFQARLSPVLFGRQGTAGAPSLLRDPSKPFSGRIRPPAKSSKSMRGD